jgi:hypothetical protein
MAILKAIPWLCYEIFYRGLICLSVCILLQMDETGQRTVPQGIKTRRLRHSHDSIESGMKVVICVPCTNSVNVPKVPALVQI